MGLGAGSAKGLMCGCFFGFGCGIRSPRLLGAALLPLWRVICRCDGVEDGARVVARRAGVPFVGIGDIDIPSFDRLPDRFKERIRKHFRRWIGPWNPGPFTLYRSIAHFYSA